MIPQHPQTPLTSAINANGGLGDGKDRTAVMPRGRNQKRALLSRSVFLGQVSVGFTWSPCTPDGFLSAVPTQFRTHSTGGGTSGRTHTLLASATRHAPAQEQEPPLPTNIHCPHIHISPPWKHEEPWARHACGRSANGCTKMAPTHNPQSDAPACCGDRPMLAAVHMPYTGMFALHVQLVGWWMRRGRPPHRESPSPGEHPIFPFLTAGRVWKSTCKHSALVSSIVWHVRER